MSKAKKGCLGKLTEKQALALLKKQNPAKGYQNSFRAFLEKPKGEGGVLCYVVKRQYQGKSKPVLILHEASVQATKDGGGFSYGAKRHWVAEAGVCMGETWLLAFNDQSQTVKKLREKLDAYALLLKQKPPSARKVRAIISFAEDVTTHPKVSQWLASNMSRIPGVPVSLVLRIKDLKDALYKK